MPPLTVPPRSPFVTFMNFPLASDLDRLDAHVAIIGMPYGDPYSIDEVTNDQTNAPTAVRRASERISQGLDRWDFDIGGTLFDGKDIKVVDVGDVPGVARDLSGHYRRAEATIRKILKAGALPVTIGGDHGVPIPVFRAFSEHGPVTLIHLDAHLDWRDEVHGEKYGWSSPMRRASEMPWIRRMVQVGLRGIGSARAEEVADARAWGSRLVPAADVHRHGIARVLDMVDADANCLVTLDCDGIDPSVLPAVLGRAPGGLLYWQVLELLAGLAAKCRIVGFDLVEFMPSRDTTGISALTAARLVCNAIAAIATSQKRG